MNPRIRSPFLEPWSSLLLNRLIAVCRSLFKPPHPMIFRRRRRTENIPRFRFGLRVNRIVIGHPSMPFVVRRKDSEKLCNGFATRGVSKWMNHRMKTKLSHPLVFISLIVLVIFLISQLSSLLFETTAFFDLFREKMKNP